ncbi:MAG: SidA/IucD/PvdA family monooxygenase [Acidimicrobiia bacterium]|nr:SidA/IucD/PvdA family monooxygenase [Acidimicrobiia bacterium]MYC57346.1 SidA/IucD/PvdA family monooxygenase [Acidimicrobiia bacterium]MYI30271.1 SidA/IucD/PvdA family monooxygenase [Acidimicrobiia bacterium]
MATRIAIIGGGPAGHTCATYSARLGAEVTLIERDIIGGAAHLWDCVPSKAMIGTGGAVSFLNRISGMGLDDVVPKVEHEGLRDRVTYIENCLGNSVTNLLISQQVRLISGEARMIGLNEVEVIFNEQADENSTKVANKTSEVIKADYVVLATGSRPRVPNWAEPDGERVLTTRHAYPPPEIPKHLVVIGSGVTGVEFVHMFASFGAEVTLIVSRQQVLPNKDPEVAAALEENFIGRGVKLFMGARANKVEVIGDCVWVQCDDGRTAVGSHALLAIGSVPNSDGLGLEEAGIKTENGYVVVDHNLRSSLPHVYAAGDLSGKLPLSSVASMQGRKIAEHIMGLHVRPHKHMDYDKAASAIFTEPEIADVGLVEADAFAEGRKVRVTKVPFSVSAKALINNDTRGFVKIISDPATGVILGGSIVGRHAAELISVLALAVNASLTVVDIANSLLVHPALSELLAEAAE